MSLRIGVDLDGTLADLSSIYHEYEVALFGKATNDDAIESEEREVRASTKDRLKHARKKSKQQEAVWRALRNTTDLWTRLKPLEPSAVRDLQAAADRYHWEVFFITQRPRSAGASVQKQSQDWLIAQGFAVPSVLTLQGSRGKAAHALDLDFLIDDLPKNCIDVISESKCRPILVMRREDTKAVDAARRMSVGVVASVSEAIALLAQPVADVRDTTVRRILKALGLSR